MSAQKALLVLGMHRSGTSAVARVLDLLGARIPGPVLPPVPGDNETGYWEPAEVTRIHDELLAVSDPGDLPAGPGDPAYSFFRLPADQVPTSEVHCEQLLDFLQREVGAAPLFLIKDPRLCRLVPLWLRVLDRFGAEPRFLVWVRNPREVAASLARRDESLGLYSDAIWLRNVLDAELDSRGHRRAFGSYAGLLSDWRGTAGRIAGALDLPELLPADPESAAVEKFLTSDLRHHRYDGPDPATDPTLAGWAAEVYDEICRSLEVGRDPSAEVLDGVRERFEGALAAFGPLLRFEEKQRHLLRQAVDERDRRLAALESGTGERDGRLPEMEAQLDERDRRLEALEVEAAASAERFAILQGRAELQRQRLAEAELALERVLSSRSWRVTAWLRRTIERMRGGSRAG